MRGVVAYSPHPTVAILDSSGPARATRGSRSSAPSRTRSRTSRRPRSSASPRRAAASRRPGAKLLKASIEAGLDVESGLHEFVSDDRRAGRARREARRRAPRPPQAARRSERADRREPAARREDRAHGRLRLRDRQEDRRDRARPGGAAARPEVGLRPHRPDRSRDRRLGHRRRRGRRGLHRRRRREARRRGGEAWGRAAHRRGPGLALASGVLRRHARAHARLGSARVRPLPRGGRDRDRGLSRLSAPAARRADRAARARVAARCARRRVAAIALNTRTLERRRGARGRPLGHARRPGFRPTTRCGSAPARSWTPSWRSCNPDGRGPGEGQTQHSREADARVRLRRARASLRPRGADLMVGVADDQPKTSPAIAEQFYDAMNDVGLTENRITILWDSDAPRRRSGTATRSPTRSTVAAAHGVHVTLSIYPDRARAITESPRGRRTSSPPSPRSSRGRSRR